jgi:hypothetical protein
MLVVKCMSAGHAFGLQIEGAIGSGVCWDTTIGGHGLESVVDCISN